MSDDGRDLTKPWMIDESGRWQVPARRSENRSRVAERGWVWIGPSAARAAARLCFRPSIVDAIAIGRAIDWLEGLPETEPVELLLMEDGRALERYLSPLAAIDRCLSVCCALEEIRILGFRNEPLEAAQILGLPELGIAWQRISTVQPTETACDDAIRLAHDDATGLTCVLTWMGDQVAYCHIGREVAFRSRQARGAWPGRPLRELGPYDAAAAELLDDLLRFRQPLLHRLELTVQRRHDEPVSVAYNRLLTLYPTQPDARPIAISFMRLA